MSGVCQSTLRLQIVDDAHLKEHRCRLQRSLKTRLQCENLGSDFFLRRLLNALQEIFQRHLALLLPLLRIRDRGLRERKLRLDILDLLLTIRYRERTAHALTDLVETTLGVGIAWRERH